MDFEKGRDRAKVTQQSSTQPLPLIKLSKREFVAAHSSSRLLSLPFALAVRASFPLSTVRTHALRDIPTVSFPDARGTMPETRCFLRMASCLIRREENTKRLESLDKACSAGTCEGLLGAFQAVPFLSCPLGLRRMDRSSGDFRGPRPLAPEAPETSGLSRDPRTCDPRVRMQCARASDARAYLPAPCKIIHSLLLGTSFSFLARG